MKPGDRVTVTNGGLATALAGTVREVKWNMVLIHFDGGNREWVPSRIVKLSEVIE